MQLTIDDLVEVSQALARDVLARDAERIDREAVWPVAGIRALLDAGMGGLVVPQRAGGLGHGLLGLARVCEALAGGCTSTAICFGMHCVGAAVVAAKATDDQRERLLEPMARGAHLTTLALSEPGTGSHFYLPETSAERTGDGLRLHGTKSFVTNGGHADSYVMSYRAANAPPGEFSCALVHGDAPGLTWGPQWSGWGLRGNSARNAQLAAVPVPAGDLLGSEGDEIWYVFHVVAPYFLVSMSGTYLGAAAAAFAELLRQVGARNHTHTNAGPAQNPIVQHRIGELYAQLERTRRLLYHAAQLGDAGTSDALPALCSAKAEVAECAVNLTNEAMTLLGGRAYRDGTLVERTLRDCRAAHVMAPTTEVLRLWTGRALLGEPLLAG